MRQLGLVTFRIALRENDMKKNCRTGLALALICAAHPIGAVLAAEPAIKKGERHASLGYRWEKLSPKKDCLVAQGAPVIVQRVTAKSVQVEYGGSLEEEPYCKKGTRYSVRTEEFRSRYMRVM